MDLLKDRIDTLLAITGKLTDNPVANFCYDNTAMGSADSTGDADGVASYDVTAHQNIPLALSSILQVNETVLAKGYRSKASSITRMLMNHFLGRTSFNLNKIIAQLNSFFTYLLGTIKNPELTFGFASLDADGRVPYSQLPESAMEYEGNWDASTNTPHLENGTGTNGEFYVVSVGGTQNLGDSYTEVTPEGTENPQSEGWYVYDGNDYVPTTDVTIDPDTTYYEKHAGAPITFLANDRVIFDGRTRQWSKLSGGAVRTVNNIAPDSSTGNVTVTSVNCSEQSKCLYFDSCNCIEMKQNCLDGKINNIDFTLQAGKVNVTNVVSINEGSVDRLNSVILGTSNSVVCKDSPDAVTDYGIVLGFNLCTDCVNDIMLGSCNCASCGNNIVLGDNNSANATSIVIGNTNIATDTGNIVLGYTNCSCNCKNTILGSNNITSSQCNVLLGQGITLSTSSNDILAIGNRITVGCNSPSTVVIGSDLCSSDNLAGCSVAIGSASCFANSAVAIGYCTCAKDKSIVIGSYSSVTGTASTAIVIGYCASACYQATGSIALGCGAVTQRNNSIAIGREAEANANYSIALGNRAKTTPLAQIVARTENYAEIHLYVNCSNYSSISGSLITSALKETLECICATYGTSACNFKFFGSLHFRGNRSLLTNYIVWNASTNFLCSFGTLDGSSSSCDAVICGCSGCNYQYPHLIGTLFIPLNPTVANNNYAN